MSNSENKELDLSNNFGLSNDEFAEVLEVSNVEAVPEHERVLDKQVFIDLLMNDLLRDVPIAFQNSKHVQERLRKKAEIIYQLKNEAEFLSAKEKIAPEYNPILDSVEQYDFDVVPWLTPVTLDQHAAFAVRCPKAKTKDEFVLEQEEGQMFTRQKLPEGDILVNQLEQYKNIKNLEKDLLENNINFVSFSSKTVKIRNPYLPPTEDEIKKTPASYQIKATKYANVYRYYGLFDPELRKERVIRGPWCIPVYLPEKQRKVETLFKIVKQEESKGQEYITAVSGEDVNINGFLVLPDKEEKTLLNALSNKKVIDNKLSNVDPLKPALYLWPVSSKKLSYTDFHKALQQFVPSAAYISQLIANKKDFVFTLGNVIDEIKKWGYTLKLFPNQHFLPLEKLIEEQTQKTPVLPTELLDREGKVCQITNQDHLLRDTVYQNKDMRVVYFPQLFFDEKNPREYRGGECVLYRLGQLKNSLDQGEFFLAYSQQHSQKGNVELEVRNLDTLEKKLRSEIKTLTQQAKKSPPSLGLEAEKVTNCVKEYVKIHEQGYPLIKTKKEIESIFQDKKISLPEKYAKLQLFRADLSFEEYQHLLNALFGEKRKELENQFKQRKTFSKSALLAKKNLLQAEKNIEAIQQTKKNLKERNSILKEKTIASGRKLLNHIIKSNLHRFEHKEQAPISQKKGKHFFNLTETNPAIDSLVSQIIAISDPIERKETIYSLIRSDGLLINKFIHSQLLRAPFICGHWYYLMMMDNASTQEERQMWQRDLSSLYGDEGSGEKGNDSCTVCGQYLERVGLVETASIDQWGAPIRIREAYKSEVEDRLYLHSLPNVGHVISEEFRHCDSKEFKREMSTRKIEGNDLAAAMRACLLFTSLSLKLGVILPTYQLMSLILTVVKGTRAFVTFEAFIEEKIKEKRRKRMLTEQQVRFLRDSSEFNAKMARAYSDYWGARFGTLVAAHFLWHMRTVVPPIESGKRSTSCAFLGYAGQDGKEFMLCLLEEMKAVQSLPYRYKGKLVRKQIKYKMVEENLTFWLDSLETKYRGAAKRRVAFNEANERFQSQRRGYEVVSDRDWSAEKVDPVGESMLNQITNAWEKGDLKQINQIQGQIQVRTLKLTHSRQKKMDKIVKELPIIIKPPYYDPRIESSCCDILATKNEKYLDFFVRIDPSIGKETEELFQLEAVNNYFKEGQRPTLFLFGKRREPLPGDQLEPFNPELAPEYLIQQKFDYFCHTGISKGERHKMESPDIYEITRCVKCTWYLKTLRETKFTRAQYKQLLENIEKRTGKKVTPMEKVKRSMDIRKLVSLRKASSKLKEDSQKLANLLARLLRGKKEEESKEFRKKRLQVNTSTEKFSKKIERREESLREHFKSFLKNITNFDNLFPGKDRTQLQRKYSFEVQKMKSYINEYLRRSISRVQHHYEPSLPVVPMVTGKNIEKWQKKLIDEEQWLSPYLTKATQKIFEKFKFDYSVQSIDDIHGVFNRWDKGGWIRKTSYFSQSNAVLALKHYFVVQITNFLEIAGAAKGIFAEFVSDVFDQITKDRQAINVPEKDMRKWNDMRREKNIRVRLQFFDALGEQELLTFNAPYRKMLHSIYEDPDFMEKYQEFEWDEPTKEEVAAEESDRRAYLASEARKQLGEDVTEKEVDFYVESKIDESREQQEIDHEVYDNPLLKEGEEIMDIGYDYGSQPQGTENAGDGFNDQTMNELWEPVHEPEVVGNE